MLQTYIIDVLRFDEVDYFCHSMLVNSDPGLQQTQGVAAQVELVDKLV